MPNDLLASLVRRAASLVLRPGATWDAIAAEETPAADLYRRWVLPLAAILPVASFIGLVIVGQSALGAFTSRMSPGSGLAASAAHYLLTLAAVPLFAVILDQLAPRFGAEKSFGKALRVAAYFPAAFWLAGIFTAVPQLRMLAPLLGLYSLYLLAVGLPRLMPPEDDKKGGFVAAAIACAVVLCALVSLLSASLLEPAGSRIAAGPPGGAADAPPDTSGADQLADAARKGDVGGVLTELLGAAATGPVADAESLRRLAPAHVGERGLLFVNVEQVDAPIRMAILSAEYGDDRQAVTLRVVNSPLLPALAGRLGFGAAGYDRSTEGGDYQRLRRKGGRWVIEEWNAAARTGRYAETRGQSFLVEATGRGVEPRELERAVGSIRTRDLERLTARTK